MENKRLNAKVATTIYEVLVGEDTRSLCQYWAFKNHTNFAYSIHNCTVN